MTLPLQFDLVLSLECHIFLVTLVALFVSTSSPDYFFLHSYNLERQMIM